MVPLAIFKRWKLSHANIVALLFQGTYVGFQFVATLYYQHVFGWSAFVTGFCFAGGGAFVMFLAPRLAALAQRRGTTQLMALGVGLQAAGYIFWFLTLNNIEPLALVIVSQVFLGLGYSMSYPAVQVAALSDAADHESGLASGLLFAAFQIGGGIVLAASSAIFSAAPGLGWDAYAAGGAFSAALAVVTTLIAVLGPRARRARVPSAVPQAAE
jgi:Na+/melibiose symporter-like transporter